MKDAIALSVGTFHRLDPSLLMNLVGLRSPILCDLFFMSCEAIEFAETEDRFEECLDLPISLSMVLHALRLECKKAVGSIIRPTHE